MIKTTHDARLPELREFIKENDQRLYDFCVYMLYGGMDVDELILSIFREFGDHYRKLTSRKDSARRASMRSFDSTSSNSVRPSNGRSSSAGSST